MLRLPSAILASTFRTLRECGQSRNECVVYWTGPVSSHGLVDAQDHPFHRRSPHEYEIDSQWLTRYWFELARAQRTIRAQVHTHPGAAFHSATDDRWPVISQPGFISIVIPNFARGAVSFQGAWIGQFQADGRWRAVPHHEFIEVMP